MNLWYKPGFLALFFFLLLSFFALKDLIKPGLYTSHDGETHTARIAQYYQALKDGQYPPRFAGTFYNGLGSPIFVYIYPLPYLFGSILHFVGFSFVNSFKILMAAGFLASGVFCFLWLKELFKSNMAAFLGTLYYTWSPYKFSLIYVRGSLSENTAYVFAPLIFYCITMFIKSSKLSWWGLSVLSYALLLLSQNLVAMIVTPILVIYSITFVMSKRSASQLVPTLGTIFFGFLIASFTYLPSFFEKGYIRFDNLIGPAYASHFPTINQLIYSPWGYGFDLPGVIYDEMSFQIGLAHVLVFLSAFILLILIILSKKLNMIQHVKYFFQIPIVGDMRIYYLFAFSTFGTILIMAETAFAKVIWSKITLLQVIDIPWRLLGLVSLSLASIAAFFAKYVKSRLIFILFVLAVLIANRNHLRINKSLAYTDDFFLTYASHATYYSEFNPRWRGNDAVPTTIDPKSKYKIIEGDIVVSHESQNSRKINLILTNNSQTARIRINKSYFPGVKVTNNGQELDAGKDFSYTVDSLDKIGNKDPENSGLIIVKLVKGINNLEVNFSETPLRLLSNLISLISFIFTILIILTPQKWAHFLKAD